jgi:DNA-binding MarR family transcriptional regulator
MYSRSSDPKSTPRRRATTGTGRSVEEARRRRRLAAAIGESLRELAIQLSLLNHQVGTQLDLRDVDLDCLDLVDRDGPLSPSALARHAGLHPATITGILDRLEAGGWVARERDPADRRGVVVRVVRERVPDLLRLYAGMNRSMNEIYAGYDESELELIADFLQRTANAGRSATAELSDKE